MLSSIFASLFGGSVLGWLGHALYIRPQQLKGAPAVVAGAVQGIENGVVAPVVTGIAQQELQNLSNPSTAVPLPSGSAIGNAVTVAALGAIQSALTGPHTTAPAAAPAPAAPSPTDAPTADSGAPPAVSATF